MLAPANFGSSLAQLGKARIGRIKSWFAGVEPGEGVLEWLELGSPEAWELNKSWIQRDLMTFGRRPVFPFVLTGQSIDHAFYDHVNAYTGELGSDGVVRVAGANLNSSYVKLVQEIRKDGDELDGLVLESIDHAPATAFRILPQLSHSGEEMGILRSVKNNRQAHETVNAVLRCLKVRTEKQYVALSQAFATETELVQQEEIIERNDQFLLPDHLRARDAFSMAIIRIVDAQGNPVNDYDIKLTAKVGKSKKYQANHLPVGFIHDTQRNSKSPNVLTFFLNHGILSGTGVPEIRDAAVQQSTSLGVEVHPRPEDGFVHFEIAALHKSVEDLGAVIKPNQTVMVDIELKRIVHEGVFKLTRNTNPTAFDDVKPGRKILSD